jgi:hypothetical protein
MANAMIQRNRLQRFTFFIGSYLDLLNGAIIVGYGSIMAVESGTYQKWPQPLPAWIELAQKNSLLVWFIVAASAFLGWYLRRRGDPWIWDKLQELLDEFQEVAFQEFQNHIKDHHRVTLFRYRKWCWNLTTPMTDGRWPWRWGRCPWSGWLVPVLRSGRTSQNTKAIFLAPDNGDEAEGVAGYAWASNKVFVVTGLPQITKNSKDAQVVKYSERTFCPAPIVRDYVARGRPLPRSIGAMPIEVNNKPWGVLVLDSRDDQGVTDNLVRDFSLMVNSISHMLEKAK